MNEHVQSSGPDSLEAPASGKPMPRARRAAQYIRMSTDAQDLSPEIQMRAIAEYAASRDLALVQTYLDAGRSGLTLQGRPAMKQLLADVAAAHCSYAQVLVYDISRWGRFQDTDASAYYEYHCRIHGVQVRYVQELFPPSDTPLGNVLKNLKRAMAAEYSRELAVKVQAGQKAAIDAGYHVGHLPCIGLARLAVSKHDGSERRLAAGEHKAASREHVRWVRGSDDEVALVRRIFELYAYTPVSIHKLGWMLRAEGVTTPTGKPLTPWMLYSLLKCEALVGDFVWGREHHGRRREAHDGPVQRVPGCIEPVIELPLWQAVQRKRAKRAGTIRSREQLLEFLRDAVERNPEFNATDLKACDGPSRTSYCNHFGSFEAALACLQLSPARLGGKKLAARSTLCTEGRRVRAILERCLNAACIACSSPRRAGHLLLVNETVRVRVQVIRRSPRHGVWQWALRKVYREHFDHVFVVRMNADGSMHDSLLLNRDDYFAFDLWFGDTLPEGFHRFTTPAAVARLFGLLKPVPVRPKTRSHASLLGVRRRDRELADAALALPGR